MIKAAMEGGYAVPNFNVCELETILAVADVAEEPKSRSSSDASGGVRLRR
jgi:fructose/tagatose bisphosphate aldolase